MRIKILAVLIVATTCFGVGYFVGLHRGSNVTTLDRDVYDVRVYSHLLRCIEHGETNLVESGVRSLLVTWCNHYDTHFGSEPVPDHLLNDLTYARAVVAQDRTNQVVNR
jgi:hypothetical protein